MAASLPFPLPLRRPLRVRLAPWLAGVAAWTLLALISSGQSALLLSAEGVAIDWREHLLDHFGNWYSWGLFTPVLFALVRRWPLDGPRWWRVLPIHLLVVEGCVLAKWGVYATFLAWVVPARAFTLSPAAFAGAAIGESLVFWALAAAVVAVDATRRAREREGQALRLQAQLAEARLESLAGQLQPHVLFNVLNGVSMLMRRDVEAADTMLARLAALLRRTMADTRHEVPLHDELAVLDDYLAIARLRFGDRLTATVDVAPAVRHALVPRLLLQPLVENALVHAVERRAGAGRIEVRAGVEGGEVLVTVRDDGAPGTPGTPGTPAQGGGRGIGLANTAQRLRELHGDRQRLDAGPAAGGGWEVRVRFPLRGAEAGR